MNITVSIYDAAMRAVAQRSPFSNCWNTTKRTNVIPHFLCAISEVDIFGGMYMGVAATIVIEALLSNERFIFLVDFNTFI